ncbi:transposase IS116/IS110/IS902 family protein [Actinocorallia herbida]|uniref:Transposase IS116/IS110/IS902 family protein n=1 Tax=Actinocorallia herbida TaxID=58109 RepID=A0A3N1D3L7_9ACTN|nr:IS110 family transposase [Actinocorallia herbida]ROO87648.1 transposase IS116/IS110/IS902 family protein [Actinocorallia herbida]
MAKLFCGIDWAERHHDIAIVDDSGTRVAKARITNDAAGLRELLNLLAKVGDHAGEQIPIAIEKPHGLLVASLRTTGRQVFAINPYAVARYRGRHGASGKKSDEQDALTLANILRTDMTAHRPLPADSDLARAITVLARAQQDAVWDRTQLGQRIRSLLHDYYAAALEAFGHLRNGGVTKAEARVILALAPTPARAATLTRGQIRAALKRAGRARKVEEDVERLHQIFRAEHMRLPDLVEQAMGDQLTALLGQLEAACAAEKNLANAVEEAFTQHPDAEIITSFPGVGPLVGARLLAELGDDRTRFADARGLKAYAGSAPVTRASGRSKHIMNRKVKNDRLAAAGYLWAFACLRPSPGARAHYDRRRASNDTHTAALRHLFNRLIGCLYHCLQTRRTYEETTAFPPRLAAAA